MLTGVAADRDEHPFVDLPAVLVEDLLERTSGIAETLLEYFRAVRADRARLQEALTEQRLVRHESKLGYAPIPTTCGVDGSYAIERLLTTDLVACAAVAMEGLIPPSEKRFWEQPRHLPYIRSEVHHEATATVLRAVMLGFELQLAARAPHELVMLDGTLTLPVIYFNQALTSSAEAPQLDCSEEFQVHATDFLDAYLSILQAERSDKNYVGLPKYSTRREVGRILKWPTHHDDRGLLTLLLEPGQFVGPLPLEQPTQPWHLAAGAVSAMSRPRAEDLAERIIHALGQVRVIYYKPHEWLPALRVEVAENVAENPHRLAGVLQGLKHQCASPGMLEPYPSTSPIGWSRPWRVRSPHSGR